MPSTVVHKKLPEDPVVLQMSIMVDKIGTGTDSGFTYAIFKPGDTLNISGTSAHQAIALAKIMVQICVQRTF